MLFVRTNDKNQVTYIRYNFTYDLNEFDVNEGYVLDMEEPEIVEIEGKHPMLMYDKEKNQLYHEYVDIIKSVDQTTKRLDELESALVELASLLGGGQ
ncbi:hypothetical protein B0H39_004665 [Clostridium beijerinckii]|uniref:hypothetical protein n=1 Tax=Clostridium beijerinckii TaxID=1520 RepID=UPI00149486EE|nr:hypothetical protein [Clostridium beijerinckii]NOW86784.1 hypothetical protein [Clostridium beijerinckii]